MKSAKENKFHTKLEKRIGDGLWKKLKGNVRVVDESGEDYLFPPEFFISVSIPETAEKIFATA